MADGSRGQLGEVGIRGGATLPYWPSPMVMCLGAGMLAS